MPKLVTVKRLEGSAEKARDYVKTHILFPSSLLGLIFMVAGTVALGYQLLATDSYSWATFVQSTGLLVLGAVLGWGQTKYHQYLLREHPDVFASRMKIFLRAPRSRAKREPPLSPLIHRGRKFVPLAYLAGMLVLLAASTVSVILGDVYYLAAYLMPWAGFFWAKLFFWRGVIR